MHIISSKIRGYSVRVNQKHRNEKPYKELKNIGKGSLDEELYQLYKLHLDKYNYHCQTKAQLVGLQKILTK